MEDIGNYGYTLFRTQPIDGMVCSKKGMKKAGMWVWNRIPASLFLCCLRGYLLAMRLIAKPPPGASFSLRVSPFLIFRFVMV